jgi:hypothetical protein
MHDLGGALGLFDKGGDLRTTLNNVAPVRRLDLEGAGIENGVDLSK